MAPSVSVIVCAYTEDRWDDLAAAVASVRAQTVAVRQTVVVVDHNPGLLAHVRGRLPGVIGVANHGRRGLSGARNSGVAAVTGDVVAFLDDDAVAEPDWLEWLLRGYGDPRVLAVGGSVLPDWAAGRPRSFPEEFDWVVGCTYRGMPQRPSAVRNVIGANMSFRRSVLAAVGPFREGIGRVGTRPAGCEETELCLRVHRVFPNGVVLYQPRAAVRHRVPAARASWRYFGARCYSEGISKALVSQAAGVGGGLSSERQYAARTLPRGVAQGLADALVRRDVAGLGRAGALVAGLTLASAGFAAGAARAGLVARPRRGAGRAKPAWLDFDVHGRAAMRVAADAPAAPQLRAMLAPFQVGRVDRPDLVVRGRLEELGGLADADGEYRYSEEALELPARRLQVVLEQDQPVRLNGPGELLAPVLALLDRLVVQRDVAMVHGATVARDGRGVLLAGAGGAGKTSAALQLVLRDGFDFMGDDWALLAGDGRLLGFAKPLFVRPHHRRLLPHVFAAQRKPLAGGRLARPLGELATAVHPVVSRAPRLARVARRWSPEHLIVPAHLALPEATIQTEAGLAATCFIERVAAGAMCIEQRHPSWMTARLLGNFHAELPRAAREVLTALGACGLLSPDRAFGDKAAVLQRATARAPVFVLQVPAGIGAEAAGAAIGEAVKRVLDGAERG